MARITNAQLEAALRKNAGIFALTATELSTSRQNVRQRVKRSPHLTTVCADIDATLLDAAEGVVANAIVKDKDVGTAKWLLERKGKARGYGNQVQAELRIPDDQLEAVVRACAGDPAALRELRARIDPAPPPPAR